MENKPAMSWEGMCHFLEQNRGLIINICRQYGVNPTNTICLQEDAYIEATKSYDPAKPIKKYTLPNHFGNLLKSKIKQELAHASKTVYLEDVTALNEENDDCGCHGLVVDITGQKPWRQNGNNNGYEETDRDKCLWLLTILKENGKKRGNGHFKKVVNYILHDDLEGAVTVMPECQDAIKEIIAVKKSMDKKA